jgi:hypothetical protein
MPPAWTEGLLSRAVETFGRLSVADDPAGVEPEYDRLVMWDRLLW